MQKNHFENLIASEISLVHKYSIDKSSYPMKGERRYANVFTYTLEGTEIYFFKDKTIEATPGTVLFIPAGERYRINTDSSRSVVICMDFQTVSPPEVRPFLFPVKDGSFFKIFSHANDIWLKKKSNYKPEVMSLFYKIVSILSEADRQYISGKNEEKIMLAVNHMHEHYTEPDFRTERLSEVINISQRYLQVLFKNKFGTSPKEYLIDLRITLAKELLKGEKNKISDICSQAGYTDVYHFSKAFKSKTGYTPKEYIKRAKELQ